MSETKIKICGLSREQDIEYVNEALPDFIGFVFAKSRRQVRTETAAELKNKLDGRIKSTGVFVNEDMSSICTLCSSGVIDYIQLHGDESSKYIETLKELLDKANCSRPIIKALRVKDSSSLAARQELNPDYLLLDTYSHKEYGGTGEVFNWNLVQNISKPFFLAGGLKYENVADAVRLVRPFCLDVSSGVETDGFKDRNKIIKLVDLIRSVK
ncbi:MAG: phosphoribosylanthranilate isomerase [Eubacterium sp.]|jgi:phosphoribosylanthranilate isomerase|nr:phosphoribosylanthranilate isomerase [Eubacterium sp.]